MFTDVAMQRDDVARHGLPAAALQELRVGRQVVVVEHSSMPRKLLRGFAGKQGVVVKELEPRGSGYHVRFHDGTVLRMDPACLSLARHHVPGLSLSAETMPRPKPPARFRDVALPVAAVAARDTAEAAAAFLRGAKRSQRLNEAREAGASAAAAEASSTGTGSTAVTYGSRLPLPSGGRDNLPAFLPLAEDGAAAHLGGERIRAVAVTYEFGGEAGSEWARPLMRPVRQAELHADDKAEAQLSLAKLLGWQVKLTAPLLGSDEAERAATDS